MKLLVTGGAGFIGSNFIYYWLREYPDDEIVNIDKLTYAGNLENLDLVPNSSKYTFIHADITNDEAVMKAMKSTDIVVHFAAESHVDRSIHDPAPFIKTNILGTYTLLECALKSGIKRFHHISTDEVFGSLELGTSEKFNENSPYKPSSPYSASKASSDHLVSAYHHTYGLPITISNCSNNFGPYQFPEKLIPLAISKLLEGKKIPIYGDGLNVRDWLYVDDHARAIDLILQQGKIGEVYCIGGNTEDISNLDVVRKIMKFMDIKGDHIEFIEDRQGHDRRYSIDWSKMKKDFDWKPMYEFDIWLKKTIEWYLHHEDWMQHVLTGEYETYYERQYKKHKS